MTRLAFGFVLLACGGARASEGVSHASFLPVTQNEWREARAEIERLRRRVPRAPRVENVRVRVRGPAFGFESRGAIAVAPGRALRMVLLGPGGSTALDVWATPDRYRLAMPELGILEKGGREAPRHLPVDLFRGWFLAPLEGRLLAAGTGDRGRIFLVRDAGPTLELSLRDEGGARTYTLSKSAFGANESVTWHVDDARALLPQAGSTVVFRRPGIEVHVTVEATGTEPPSDEAFDEPNDTSEPAGSSAEGDR